MRRRVLAIPLALLLALAVAAPAGAVTNGTPDGNNHPYVGLLVFDTLVNGVPTPTWRCSGSLISPTVVLTAAHCTDGAVAARAWFQPDVTYAVVPFPLYPYGGPGSGAFEGTPYVFPGYASPFAHGLPGFSYGDIGIVVLSQPVPTSQVSAYAQLPTAGTVETLPNKAALDYVGYGVQVQVQAPGVKPYDRWAGPRVRNYAPGQLVPGNFKGTDNLIKVTMNAGGDKGGTCFGDSGGPDLLGGTSTVLAVNSFVTNSNCSGVGYDTRVDVQARLDWINSFLSVPTVCTFDGAVTYQRLSPAGDPSTGPLHFAWTPLTGMVSGGYWNELYQTKTYHADITAGTIGLGTADLTFYYHDLFNLTYYVSGSFSRPLDVSDPANPIEEPWTLDGFLGYSTPVPTVNPFTAAGAVVCH
jgi:Trypsin